MLKCLKIIIIAKVITIIVIIMSSGSSTKRVSGLYPIEVRACNAKPNCKHTEEDDDDDDYHDYFTAM